MVNHCWSWVITIHIINYMYKNMMQLIIHVIISIFVSRRGSNCLHFESTITKVSTKALPCSFYMQSNQPWQNKLVGFLRAFSCSFYCCFAKAHRVNTHLFVQKTNKSGIRNSVSDICAEMDLSQGSSTENIVLRWTLTHCSLGKVYSHDYITVMS